MSEQTITINGEVIHASMIRSVEHHREAIEITRGPLDPRGPDLMRSFAPSGITEVRYTLTDGRVLSTFE